MNKETENRIRCENIKSYIEKISGVEDIGKNSRQRDLSDLRKLYCYLAKKYTKSPARLIGQVLRYGFDHSTVLHNIKKFEELNFNRQLKCQNIVEYCENSIINLNSEYKSIFEEKNRFNPKNYKELKHIDFFMKIAMKGHSVILRKSAEILKLKQKNKELNEIIHNNIEKIILL